jgi:hypothetical protein
MQASQGPNPARSCQFVVGDGSGTSFPITHNLGNHFPVVQVYEANAPFEQTQAQVVADSADHVTVTFGRPPAPGAYVVVVIG